MTQQPSQHSPVGFFPNLISIVFFLIILGGLFVGATRFYPELAMRYYERLQNGQQTDNSDQKAREIAPFVRGVMSGVKTASISALRQQGALNIAAINGYEQGLRTALLASKNWYNLDRQLFRIRGIELGVKNALANSTSTTGRATLSYQVQLIQKIQLALNTNLEELLLENSDNRRRAIENYLTGLKELSEEANIEIQNMQGVLDEAQAEYDQASQISDQFSDAFVAETEEFVTENIDTNLNQYLEARTAAEAARVKINSTSEILQRLQPLAQRLPQVISAIEANLDALASGIKITPTPGVNLPLIETN